MTRWLIAAVIIVLPVIALWPVTRPRDPTPGALDPLDELLANELRREVPLEVKVPAGLDAIALTTWGVVATPRCDAMARHPYGFTIAMVDETGQLVQERRFELESRVSCDAEGLAAPQLDDRPAGLPNGVAFGVDYAARLAGSGHYVTDPRTTTIAAADLLPRGGWMRVTALPGLGSEATNRAPAPGSPPGSAAPIPPVHDLLVRVEGRSIRGETQREIYERSLNFEERRRILGRSTSLGFADLPGSARDEMLSFWDRRLEAAGREGVDYSVQRLLLRDFRAPFPAAVGQMVGFTIGDRRDAALNLEGKTSLRILAPPGRTLHVSDGGAADRVVEVNESGIVELPSSSERPRTILVTTGRSWQAPAAPGEPPRSPWAMIGPPSPPNLGEAGDESEFLVRFLLPQEGMRAQIGDVTGTPLVGGGLEIAPDVRVVEYLTLDPVSPVIARIAPEQEVLILLVRSELAAGDLRDISEVKLTARWSSPKLGVTEHADLSGLLLRSRFERWRGGGAATDPRRVVLRVPAGVDRVEILGDAPTRVALRTLEPGVVEDVVRLPYRRVLGEDELWRYAPFDTRRESPIRAANHDDLVRIGRAVSLSEQVRIERRGDGTGAYPPRPEKVLRPLGAPIRRRLLSSSWLSPDGQFPGDAWTRIDRERLLTSAGEGRLARRMEVIYRADPSRLGETARLFVDGKPRVELPIATLAGQLATDVTAGDHSIAVEGLGDGGVAYAAAAPAGGGAIARRRDVHELSPQRSLEYRFTQEVGETLHVVLLVGIEGPNTDFALRYDIDGGTPRQTIGHFSRIATIPSAVLTGRTGDLGRGLLWEGKGDPHSPNGGPDGLARVKIHLGDDLARGNRTVRLRWSDVDQTGPTPRRLWIAAVLVGRGPPVRDGSPRLWVDQDP